MSPSPKLKNYQFGKLAELVVIIYLRLKFYQIIARRYKTKLGEIDIIAYKANKLIAVEVKARKNFYSDTTEIFTKHQARRIKNTISYFLYNNPRYKDCLIRFDLILVNRFFVIKHCQNYW